MRIATFILLSALWSYVGINARAEAPCSRPVVLKQEQKTITAAQLAHRILLQATPTNYRNLYFGDVEFILKCGTSQDAAELFASVRNTSIKMVGATVVEADAHMIRVSWNDGFQPNLAAFRFNFDNALTAIPRPGEKIVISGAYLSYSQEPFQIEMANPSFSLPPLVPAKVHQEDQ